MPVEVKAKFKDVYFEAFHAINSVVPVSDLRDKCGGKCANFLISALAIVLTHACQGAEHCRRNDPDNPQCMSKVYSYANESIENMEPVAITCFQTVQINITPIQSRHIAVSMTNAVINAVKPRENEFPTYQNIDDASHAKEAKKEEVDGNVTISTKGNKINAERRP